MPWILGNSDCVGIAAPARLFARFVQPTTVVQQAPNWLVWVNLWIVYIVWGSTYLAIRIVVRTMPPMLTAGVRFVVAGALMGGWLALRRGRGTLRVSRAEMAGAAIVGTALLAGANGLVMVAEQTVASSLAALIIASVPLWVVVLRFATGERVPALTLASVAAGFAGVALLVLPGGDSGTSGAGAWLLLMAALAWASGSFYAQRLAMPGDLLVSTTYQMVLGGAVAIVAGLVVGEASDLDPARFSAQSLWAALYLVLIGSLVAFTAYVWLLRNAPISKVATYAYVNPVVAIFLGWAILSERITPVMGVGAAIIIGSVALIVGRQPRPARAPEPGGAAVAEHA